MALHKGIANHLGQKACLLGHLLKNCLAVWKYGKYFTKSCYSPYRIVCDKILIVHNHVTGAVEVFQSLDSIHIHFSQITY